ncbi:hypothetical protein IL306_004569 [Fusarium sp. DS 682]|nr:hypothetical protein IL306_004569 [Fusarium sp. DS 682]
MAQDSEIKLLLEEIDDNSWMIGHVVFSRHASKPSGPCWDDGKGAFFTVSDAPNPRPPTRPLSDTCPIVYFETFGQYEIGLAYLNINLDIGTPAHVTMEALADRSLSFQVPKVYYHGSHRNYYYVVYSSFPSGRNLIYAWPETKDHAIRARWAGQIADAYMELAKWSGSSITGIDGGLLGDNWLSKNPWNKEQGNSPETLRESCSEFGADCSELVFSHNNLHPLAFTVNEKGLVGISLWEDAGFVPKDWIRTKTRANCGLDSAGMMRKLWTNADKNEWDQAVESAFKDRGFKEFWHNYTIWRDALVKFWRKEDMFPNSKAD